MKNLKNTKKELSIVVLEDNDGDFVLIEDYLIEAFRTVQVKRFESFSDFKESINNHDGINIDLILLDLHLPDIFGLELIQKMLSEKIKAPIIILSGYTDLSLVKDSLNLGIDDFLIKDELTPGILLKSIEFALSRNQYVKHIETQNETLRKIAWTQSHVVRAPLARILGIIDLIETEKENQEDLMFWLKQLRVSSNEMDEIVKKIIVEAKEIQLKKNE
jgi:DNA-binding response OmpR family regulator